MKPLPSFVYGFHSCERDVGLKVLLGKEHLKPSTNSWDWLGHGIYFWEHNTGMGVEYAKNVSIKKQFAKGEITNPL